MSCIPTIQEHIYDQEKETILIKTQYKTIDHGYIKFLFLNYGKQSEEKVFSCSINKSTDRVYVSLKETRSANHDSKITDFLDSESWNKKQRNSWREKVYSKIHNNFLYLSNKEKVDVLIELSVKQ